MPKESIVAFAECVEQELVRDVESEEGHAASLNRSRVRPQRANFKKMTLDQ